MTVIICILSLNSINAFAVENYINFIKLEEETDLSHSVVKTVLQDSKGYMWFGTNNGLTKYDGYNTKTYRQMPFERNTILDNYIVDIKEDKQGIIWIGTNKGLTKFNSKENKFKHYKHNRNDKNSLSSNKVTSILEDKEGNLWIGTDGGGLNKYSKQDDNFKRYKGKLSSDYITKMYQDKEGSLWVGTEHGLNKINIKTDEVEIYEYSEDDSNTLSGNNITAICEDRYGDLWVGTLKNGLNRIDVKKDTITRYLKDESNSYSIGSNFITSIIEDRNGTIWIGSKQGGLARYDRENNLFIKRLSDPRNPYTSANEDNIVTLYQDKMGLIWVGLESGGINKLNPQANFSNYKSIGAFKNSINDSNILSLYKDKDGKVWLGTRNGGVNKLDFDKRTVEYYSHKLNDENSITSNTVNHIMEDRRGTMWIGTENGLNSLNKQTGEIKKYFHEADNFNSIADNNISYIYEDSQNSLWIGTQDGLDIYNQEKNEFIHYNVKNSDLSGNHITTIYEDNDKNIWIGTFHDGLNKYDRNKKIFRSYKNNSEDRSTISNDHITGIVDDRKGNLWIGTSNGLNKFNKKREVFEVFTESDHIKSNFISGVLLDDFDKLWISSNDGISKFDIEKGKVIKSYSTIDGLQGNYFNSGAVYKDSYGQLLFGGTNGFNTIYPEKEVSNFTKPQIIMNKLTVNDEEIDIENTKEIVLPYDQNRFYFEYTMTDYKKPSKNRYSFKLEGYEDDWNHVKDRNYGTYNNIEPGEYTLKIKGINSESIWNEKDVELKIKIKPPFWKTKLSYFIYLILAILIAYLILNYVKVLEKIINERTQELNTINKYLLGEIKQRKETEEILKETIDENKRLFDEKMEVENFRNDFFINLSHELRTPLNMILSTVQVSEACLKNKDLNKTVDRLIGHFKLVKKNCYRLLKTANDIIDVAKIESRQYDLNMKKVNIIYLVEEMVLSSVDYAKQKNLQILFDTETEEEIIECDPVEIERAILNVLSNAIKYTEQYGHIWVNIYIEGKHVKIVVKDNGIGIPKDKQSTIFEKFKRVNKSDGLGSGVGLSLTKLLVDMHNGSIDFTSEESRGSEFIIRLPIYEVKEGESLEITKLDEVNAESIDLEIEMSEIN
ncbi:sensor signal transduction histidine kinase [Gottschalkia acidurici 9a]|uniref:histidine kinase n=1 Tax=Gottschalkia acidurici (strain ATCC 7906 / DSM 604 / BCRC 14475 / CIP 104303 / KCTC 5404 / NCIMB 10678 / 9a) TaxID=1128398 RepID=K0B380_GOTA9|nr:sensor signal transduction histidine kinase [Gottschalkia acidurici 9a]